MRASSRFFLAAFVLYLALGVAYQFWTCATWSSNLGRDGLPPDIPCAGIPWSIFVIGLWPANSLLDFRHGHPLAAACFVAAFGALIVIGALGLRKGREH